MFVVFSSIFFHIDLRFGLVWTSPLHVTSTSKLNIVSMLTRTKRTYTRIDTNVDVNARQTLSLHDEGQRRKQYNEHCNRVNRSQGLFTLNESECERNGTNKCFFFPKFASDNVNEPWRTGDATLNKEWLFFLTFFPCNIFIYLKANIQINASFNMIKVHKKTSLYIIMKSVQQVDGIQRHL